MNPHERHLAAVRARYEKVKCHGSLKFVASVLGSTEPNTCTYLKTRYITPRLLEKLEKAVEALERRENGKK